ncbi:BppU family phage baseplate upper protein [Bacillus mycoides]|uniref:BppU family phage baseplate upper protein n=1 Tax=Bacillus mycoides TaxID=1405 RepID=UPI0025A1E26B|nr:BppU family phage baseplate upper protein [Bacillus mycoides]MDM5430244.1 BppU family phage baseplate upper protein [Bacillus mycoides]
MTFKTHEITVDLVNDVSTTVARFSQGDQNSAKLILNLTSKGEELDLSQATAVRITFKKPDGTTVFQEDCQPINVMKGKYQIILKTQTLAAAGNVYGQVRIFEGDRKLDAEPFVFAVKQSFSNDAAVESTNEFTIIKKAIEAGEILKDVDIPALIASKTAAEAAKKKADENAVQIGDLQKSLSKQDVKTQLLQHGPNIVNATVASPLNVEVQGRTLVNLLGQTTLDPTKYYLFMPNKGTTKITAGGSSYDGVAKFTGQSAISYTIKQDFRGKVAGSTIENGNAFKARTGATIGLPINPGDFSERNQNDIDKIKPLDNVLATVSTSGSTNIAQTLFSFDIIRTLQDKYGSQIWQGKTALADKITIAKQLVVDYAAVLYANGSSPQGNKLYVKRWIPSTSTWFGSTTNTESNLTKVQTGSTNVQEIDSNGFIHVIAYADASDGTRPSVVNIDYAMLELKTKMDTNTPMLEDALYEVDQATYNKINVDPEYSGSKLIDKFPYVEGIQHLNPVVVTEGANLTPGLSEWTHSANAKVIGIDVLEILSTGLFQQSIVSIEAFPSTTYTYTVEKVEGKGAFIGINFIDGNGNFISQINANNNIPSLTVTTPPNCRRLQLKLTGREPGNNTLVFSKPMCVIGDKPKPFVPRNPSYLYTNTVLAGINGVNDVLYKEDGQWKVLRKLECEVVLDGAREWILGASYTDFKQFRYAHGLTNYVPVSGYTVKPTGKQIFNGNTSTAFDITSLNPNGTMYLSVSNQDTGFVDMYQPVVDEVKAFFNGWKVKSADANGKPTAWVSLVDGQDAPTQTLAYVRANRAAGYTPYKLTYQLATPRVENVQVEGDLVVDGLAQVTVDSGVVVREKANPVYDSNYSSYSINADVFAESRLKYKPKLYIGIYKNGIEDKKWNIVGGGWGTINSRLRISKDEFDPKAEYTVTYLVLDKHLFTTNATDVKVSYNQSVRSTVDELTVKQSDTITGLSILQNLMTDVLARLKANSL